MHPGLYSRSTRRGFLGTLGLSAAALAWPWPVRAAAPTKIEIAKVESFPIRYPMVGRFKFFEGPPGSPAGRPAVVVKITADNGAVGWGQSVPIPKWSYETLETVHSTLTRHLAPELLGRDPFDIDGIHAAMNRAIAPSFSTGQPICKAGVDLALFDLTGKLLKQSAAQRWGRKGRDRLTLSWTLNPRTLDKVEPLIAQASGAAIFVAPDHPDFPPEWLTRHYGVICLGWPGVQPKTFQPGETIRCRYWVWIHRGATSVDRLKQAYQTYGQAR